MKYTVFVQRAVTPGTEQTVAAAIAQRYGLPVEAIASRLASGSFQVKAGCDHATAKALEADLQRLGAVVLLKPEKPAAQTMFGAGMLGVPNAPSGASAPIVPPADVPTPPAAPKVVPPAPVPTAPSVPKMIPPVSANRSMQEIGTVGPSTPGAQVPKVSNPLASTDVPAAGPANATMAFGGSVSGLTPPPAAAAQTIPPDETQPTKVPKIGPANATMAFSGAVGEPPAPAPDPSQEAAPRYESGLAAAAGGTDLNDAGFTQLGENFSLASLDGVEDDSPPPQFEETPAAPRALTEDAFLPPDEGNEEAPLEMEDLFAPPPDAPPEEVEIDDILPPSASSPAMSAASSGNIPLPGAAQSGTMPAASTSQEIPVAPKRPTKEKVNLGKLLFGRGPVRFGMGLFVAVLIGFGAAHFISSLQEGFYEEQDRELLAEYKSATTLSIWETLPGLRDTAHANKESKRQSILASAFGIWIIVLAGTLFVWFRLIPWDSIEEQFG